MLQTTSRNAYLKASFVIGPEDVRKLSCGLTTFLSSSTTKAETADQDDRNWQKPDTEPVVKFDIECSDGLTRHFFSAAGLLSFENSQSHNINSLRISASAADWKQNATVTFRNSPYSTVYIDLNGPDEAVEKFSREIDDRLEAVRPWYARFTTLDFSFVFFLLFAGLLLVQFLAAGFSLSFWADAVQSLRKLGQYPAVFLILAAWVAVQWGLTLVLNRCRARLFPVGVFAIGQGENRHKTMDKWRWAIVTSVVFGFIVSLAAGILLR